MSEPLIDVSALSREQRLDLVEKLWSTVSDENRDAVSLTNEQLAELDRRLDWLEAEGPTGTSAEEPREVFPDVEERPSATRGARS